MYGLTDDIQEYRAQIQKLEKENAELRNAIANQRSDDLCWLKDVPAQVPPRDEFLKSCERYHAQLAGERGINAAGRTIAQLEAIVARQTKELVRVTGRANELQALLDWRQGRILHLESVLAQLGIDSTNKV